MAATSQQLQIRGAIAAALVAAAVLSALRIHENRAFALATGVDSQLHVNFRRSLPEQPVMFADHPIDWDSDFELTVVARKTASVEASDVADAVWAAAFAALMADQTLGGLVEYLQPGECSVEDAEGDTSLCRLTWTFTARHRTANNTIT
jgi:hypothetical protein